MLLLNFSWFWWNFQSRGVSSPNIGVSLWPKVKQISHLLCAWSLVAHSWGSASRVFLNIIIWTLGEKKAQALRIFIILEHPGARAILTHMEWSNRKLNLEVKIEMLMERKKVESRDSSGQKGRQKDRKKEIPVDTSPIFHSQVFSGYFTWVTSYLMYWGYIHDPRKPWFQLPYS